MWLRVWPSENAEINVSAESVVIEENDEKVENVVSDESIENAMNAENAVTSEADL